MAVSGLTRNLKFSDGVEVTPPEDVVLDDIGINTLCYGEETNSTSTGANQTLVPTKVIHKVTNAGLESVAGIDTTNTCLVILTNKTGDIN